MGPACAAPEFGQGNGVGAWVGWKVARSLPGSRAFVACVESRRPCEELVWTLDFRDLPIFRSGVKMEGGGKRGWGGIEAVALYVSV